MNVSWAGSWSRSLVDGRAFLRRATLLFVASTVGNGLGYVYHIFAGRVLEPQSFGVFGSLFGIFYVTSLMGDALRIAIANNVAYLKGRVGSRAAIVSVRRPVLRLIIVVSVAILIMMAGARGIAAFLHMDSVGPVLVLGGALLTVLLLFSVIGLAQGLQLFRWLAVTGYLVPHSLKLLFAALFVSAGWGLGGIIAALLASNAVAIMVGAVPLLKFFRPVSWDDGAVPVDFRSFAIPVLMMAAIISVPTSVDVILVTHFFDPLSAGIYNAVAIMGKVVLFLPVAVSLVMLPQVNERRALGQRTVAPLLLGLCSGLAVSGAVVLLYWLVPEGLIGLFLGDKYLPGASLVGWYGLAMLFVGVNYLFAQYDLATSNRAGVLVAMVVTLVEVVTILLWHDSLGQVVLVLLVGNLLLVMLNLLSLARRRARLSPVERGSP